MPTANVPTYALYGEHDTLPFEPLHCESIADRSGLYGWEIEPHRHDAFVQILYIESGSGRASFEDGERPFEGPCVLFVPARQTHGFRFSPATDGAVVTIVAKRFEALVGGAGALAACFVVPHVGEFERGSTQFAALRDALRDVAEEFHGDAPWRTRAIETLLSTALLRLARTISTTQGADGAAQSARSQWHLQRFRGLLEGGFRSERAIGVYARQLGITPTQLNRVCRQAAGESALGLIHRRLITQAERELAYSALSVKAVALSLGFADAGYFTRFFIRRTGRSPTEFREAARDRLAK